MCIRIVVAVGLFLVSTLIPLKAAESLIISEFVAANSGPFADEDGEFSDWIEIHNPGGAPVNLGGWYLTDAAGNLVKWQFPSTNIAPNGYLVVFASNKNRRTPGRPLHTNFRLDAGGEYLALVRPNGTTVEHAYAPTYPGQVPRVSYGVPVQEMSTVLVATGAAARVYIPTNDALGATWVEATFNDSAWTATTTGIGFERDGQSNFTPQTIANSVSEFSGQQGGNSWYYGYWDKKADPDNTYSAIDFFPFPAANEPYGVNNYWTGSAWDWFNGDPPWTTLTANGGHPTASNGNPAGDDHWVVRRYVSEHSGPIKITGRVEHTSDWVYVTQTAVAANSALYVYLTAPGDGYIDDLKLVAGSVAEAGQNLIQNGEFETTFPGPWTVSANHAGSALDTTVKRNGNSSLRIVANAGGTTQSSSIWQNITPALTSGQTYTLSYWYKPGSNNAPLVIRFSGNWIDTRPVFCGDGVLARIFVDGAEVYQRIAYVSGENYQVTVPVTTGSLVDFVLDPRANDSCDAATFTANIETSDPATTVVADSIADWSFNGVQGENNWFYGYYNRTADANATYSAGEFNAFPRANTPWSAGNYWTGTIWDWFAGNPPWTEIGQTAMHPNGVNNSTEHWAIRRWVSEVSGRIIVEWRVAKANPNGAGVTGRVFHNGVQRDIVSIPGNDTAGVVRTVTITNVAVGDFIDLSLDPLGPSGDTSDGSDGSTMSAIIRGEPSLRGTFASNIESAMFGVNPSAYLRIPFVVTNDAVDFLSLRMKYDDGFVIFLNGVNVFSRNAPVFPDVLTWNSRATTNRNDIDSLALETFDLTEYAELIQPGTNVLAIQGLNVAASDSDFLILPELRAVSVTLGTNNAYFGAPSPGAPNGPGSTNLGPVIVDLTHTPAVPQDHENLTVTARVFPTFHSISNVQMVYRVMFSNEVTVPMFDDGAHGDGAAGDGTWGAIIPHTVATPGQMIRYYISATDVRTNRTREPAYLNPIGSPQYRGTIVYLEETNHLPVLHWFIQNPTGANTAGGARGSIFFRGQFRDNVLANIHGQSSSGFNTLKKSYDFDLNPDEGLRVFDEAPRVDDFNLLTTFADKSHMRNMLNYNTYIDAGVPTHFAFAVRVQQNGTFFAVYNFVENGDDNYLQRIGYDENGALYKMYNSAENTTGAEKKTRKFENNADLQALINGSSQGTVQARMAYAYDNMDIPGYINFLAVKAITSDHDCCHKNYYFYRDTEGSGEWTALPWDADLSFGRIWSSGPAYFDDANYVDRSWMVGGNTVMSIFYNTTVPTFRQMYMRRVRTLMDEFLGQHPGTNSPYYDERIEYQKSIIGPDAALDFAKWATWGTPMTMTQNANQIKTNYVPGRRAWLNTAQGEIPASQPGNAVIRIADVEFNPSSGNQAQEFICVTNPNNYLVDVSGWQIDGAVRFTFKGGTVLPANSAAYVVADKKAFRARTSGPRGGQSLLVLGPYDGQLSAHGETLTITDKAGRVVSTNVYPGAPSAPQLYLRVTELMYAPGHPGAGSPYLREDFEFIELKNIGPVAIDLTGVHFTNGIAFAFSSANITTLAAGQTIIIAKNPAAFAARYPGVPHVYGPYTGSLDNNGESIRIDDAVGEKILEFTYNNSWQPMSDGNGFSLVIVDENAPWHTWGNRASWRLSSAFGGSPGAADPAPTTFAPIVVNEVLAHTDLPDVDSIELHNPTTESVDIGDWWISDDFATPQKYRIPAGTIIPAGGYAVFTEADFNNGGPTSFSFSSTGDEAFVFSGNSAGQLSGYFEGLEFAASANGVSFGRHFNSQTNLHFVAQSSNTFGFPNAAPRVGPVIVSEIMYRPPDIDGADNTGDEFIELHNITTNDVPLFDPAFPTNAWRLDDAVDFTFSTNDVVPANGYLIVVSFDPATNVTALANFRGRYGVPETVRITGPYDGKLDNSSDKVELRRPDTPNVDQVPYVLVERVNYRDALPWDGGADGFGPSLQRRLVTSYGNEPTNWIAALPTAGAGRSDGEPPVITQQPQPVTIIEGNVTNVSVTVSGTAPFGYQWHRNGAPLHGQTNSFIPFASISTSDAGVYSVVVFNAAGTAFSSNALVTVHPLPKFTQQPASVTVTNTSTVSLNVAVTGTGSILYQWRFNGADIHGETNNTLTITNAEMFVHTGDYDVRVTDDVATIQSDLARVLVAIRPAYTNQPQATVVLAGETARFEVLAGPEHPLVPLYYRWTRNGQAVVGANGPVLLVTNALVNGTFRCLIANAAFTNIGSASATLTVLADHDRDGMADNWERSYGFSTNNAADAQFDADGDGMTNRDEYVANTNPTNALSVLKIAFSMGDGAPLQFTAQSNVSYTVQFSTNLNGAPWVNVTNISKLPTVRTIEVRPPFPALEVERFYRIVTPQAE